MKAVMARSSYLDWSVVSDGYVAKALEALMTAERMADRWDGITPQELAIHRLVLLGFVRAGMPPTLNDLKMSTGQTLVDLRSSLRSLQRRDLVLFEDDVIVAAYPFSATPTQHRVSLGGRRINAICAIDALGTAAMTGHETTVQSSCPECEGKIKVSIKPTTAIIVSIGVHDRSVSRSVNPLRRPTIQNPLSFIQEHVIEPNPIAR